MNRGSYAANKSGTRVSHIKQMKEYSTISHSLVKHPMRTTRTFWYNSRHGFNC